MKNIIQQDFNISKQEREELLNQKSLSVWLTGLSGSGKSTIANTLCSLLHNQGKLIYILDGDNIRFGLNSDLGFSNHDRKENIRRIAEVCKLMNDAGIIVITSFISPFIEDRELAKNIIGEDNFIEVFVDTPLSECEKRDPKGLYKKVRNGEIKMFTGIDSPYEPPLNPNLIIKNTDESITPEISANEILNYIIKLI